MTTKTKILIGVLGVLVFAGAVFGAYRLGQRQAQLGLQPIPAPGLVATPTPTQEVTITTDKTEYEQGEIIKYTVKNNRDVAIMFHSPSGSSDTAYFDIEKKIDDEWMIKAGFAGSPCLLGESPKLIKVEPGVEHKLIWDQWFCNTTTVENEKLSEGVYRINFRYRIYYGIGMPEEVEAYSNEFTIK